MTTKINLALHPKQHEVYGHAARHKVLCASRRFGKTRLALTTAITLSVGYRGLYDPLSPPSVLIGAATLKQAKALYWRPLISFFDGQPFVRSINRQDLSIHFYGPRPSIVLRGTDTTGDTIRGLKLAAVVLDEVQQIPLQVINEVVRPALADTRGSRSLYIGTPKGKQNTLYLLREEALKGRDSAFFKYTAYDNPHLPPEEIERLKRLLPPRAFRQELLAEFEDYAGALFSELNESALVGLQHEPGELFYVALDPGAVNAAIVVFSLTQDNRFKVWRTFWESRTLTTAALVEQVREMVTRLGVVPRAIFIPDDRVDLVQTFRESSYKQAIKVPRSSPGPQQRIAIMNTLYYQQRIQLDSTLRDFYDEQMGLHRATNSVGQVLEDIAKGQPLHRTDALGYGIGRLVKERRELLRLTQVETNG